MSDRLTVAGIDPGLVHTGIVVLDIYPSIKTIDRSTYVIEGEMSHALLVKEALAPENPDHTFVESYRERATGYSTNTQMRKLMADLRKALPKAKVLDNTGVKKVVRRPLMELFGCTTFPTTHHQDLQSAARILLYGMLKDEELNGLATSVVRDHLAGQTWKVTSE